MLRMMPIRVTVWHEYRHEKTHPAVAALYPDGMHQAIAAGLRQNDPTGQFQIRTATHDEPEHGLSAAVLDATDVLIWWGHAAHHEVRDEVAARVSRACGPAWAWSPCTAPTSPSRSRG